MRPFLFIEIEPFCRDFSSFEHKHCWQYEIRIKNLESDLVKSNLTLGEAKRLTVSDFDFRFVSKCELDTCKEISQFVEMHEWLGSMPRQPTHRFIASYRNKLAGVVVLSTPNGFSHLLGKENRNLEKLISRGACISWSPKNLASALIMFAIRWMVKNTSFRYFTAYSDPRALEIGTIYQACNFYYLGQNSGARYEYFDSDNPQLGWFTDRYFRSRSQYKKYAAAKGIRWQKAWHTRRGINWAEIPDDVEASLRKSARDYYRHCLKRKLPLKHKYVYVLGGTKNETRKLKQLFYSLNPSLHKLPYPKDRIAYYAAVKKITGE